MDKLRYIYIAAVAILGVTASAAEVPTSAKLLYQAHQDHRQGYLYHIQKDYDEALLWYEKSAATGLAKSEYAIGRILAFDREGRRNYAKALPWIIRASEPRTVHQGQGFWASQRQARDALDWYCRKGPAEFPESHALYEDPKCLEGRGKALMSGKRRVKKDYAKAELLLQKAVAAGRVKAQSSLDRAKLLNTPKAPRDYSKLAWSLASLLLFVSLMRILRWRQRLFWLIHKLQP